MPATARRPRVTRVPLVPLVPLVPQDPPPVRRRHRLVPGLTAVIGAVCVVAGAVAQTVSQPTSVGPGAPAPSQATVAPAPAPAAASTNPGTSPVPSVAPGADPSARATTPGTSPAPASSTSPGTPVATNPSRSTAPDATATAPGTGPVPGNAATSAGTPVPPQMPRGTLDAGPQAIADPGAAPNPPDGTLRRPAPRNGAVRLEPTPAPTEPAAPPPPR